MLVIGVDPLVVEDAQLAQLGAGLLVEIGRVQAHDAFR
jgi:hypothetical protein